jgi:hypothetical protein
VICLRRARAIAAAPLPPGPPKTAPPFETTSPRSFAFIRFLSRYLRQYQHRSIASSRSELGPISPSDTTAPFDPASQLQFFRLLIHRIAVNEVFKPRYNLHCVLV